MARLGAVTYVGINRRKARRYTRLQTPSRVVNNFKVENNTTIGNQARPPTIQLKLETFKYGECERPKTIPNRTERGPGDFIAGREALGEEALEARLSLIGVRNPLDWAYDILSMGTYQPR